MKPRTWFAGALVSATLSLAPLAAHAGLVHLTDLFVFGDSLSDAGNSGLLTQQAAGVVFPPSPYAGGRSSNGPVAVERLWNSFNPGSTLAPSLAGGTDFAIGGSTTGLESFNEVNPNVPAPLQPVFHQQSAASQLAQFQNYASAHTFDPDTSLFFIWLFPNDVFYASATGQLPGVVPGSPGGANVVANGIANILTMIQILAAAGAEHFVIANMANLADTPGFAGTPEAPALEQLTDVFNAGLAAQLDLLDAAIAADIVQFDTHAAFEELLAHPGAHGFTNTTDACVQNLANQLCDPGSWVFWDGVHPTTATHAYLARLLRHAVPEPGSLILLSLGLLALGFILRRRPR